MTTRPAFWEIVDLLGLTDIQGPSDRAMGSLPAADIKRISEAVGVPYAGERVRTWRLVIERLGGTVDEDNDVSTGGTIENPGLEKVRDLLVSGSALRNSAVPAPTVAVVAAAVTSAGDFDPSSITDQRNFTTRAIAVRQGQPQFRASLIEAYDGRCAVTGCDTLPALEAAHIDGYKGVHSNHPQNGLLLRADIHTLFDIGLLGVWEGSESALRVVVHRTVTDRSYRDLHFTAVREPADAQFRPSRTALAAHLAAHNLP